MKPQNQKIYSRVTDYLKSYPEVKKISVFGSYARNENTASSDLDILVEFEKTNSIDLFKFAEMREDLNEKLGLHVDLLTKGFLSKQIEPYIYNDLAVIYER